MDKYDKVVQDLYDKVDSLKYDDPEMEKVKNDFVYNIKRIVSINLEAIKKERIKKEEEHFGEVSEPIPSKPIHIKMNHLGFINRSKRR